jgi:drug/metabolite transporter (DMT)-like permease
LSAPLSQSRSGLALLALIIGALGIASSGIFVRVSETGPTATAVWRGAFALPFLGLWACIESRGSAAERAAVLWRLKDPRLLWAGFFFAGDLALWHWSLLLTSIAASTLEANLAPIFVTVIAWFAWRERPHALFLLALALALVGMGLMVSPKLAGHRGGLGGDLLGVGTAVFYASYLAVVSRLRSHLTTGVVMWWTTVVFIILLLPLALTQKFVPDTAHGWLILIGLGLSAQFVGQGLIAYALAHLPATFGSIGLYVQPLASAFYAWLLLGERLTALQLAGAVIVLGAIGLARAARRAAPVMATASET